MSGRLYFPLGKAYGDAFCNRTEEIAWLVGNLKSAKHSLVIAPRRYGKSSLVANAIKRCKLPSVSVDMHLAVDEKDVETIILKAVADLIGTSIGQINKITNLITQTVKTLHPKISLGSEYARLEIEASPGSRPALNIVEALLLLEKLLAHKNKKAVLFMDEFQVVGLIAKGKGIEGAIRSAAQEMQHLSIIFSGSNRSTLRIMFEDEGRPLYKLCRKLMLERIGQVHYEKHIQAIAKETWDVPLAVDTFEDIMCLTERHPYYMNYLCDVLWSCHKTVPDLPAVNEAWLQIIEEERSDLLKEFLELADSQRKVLIYIANVSGRSLSGKEASLHLDMSVSTIRKAASILLEKDIVEQGEGVYTILNPALKTLLKKNS